MAEASQHSGSNKVNGSKSTAPSQEELLKKEQQWHGRYQMYMILACDTLQTMYMSYT